MSLSLTQIPVELLANITSRLSSSDILGKLRECGDSALTSRLKQGGVVDLEFEDLKPQSQARIDFMTSLQLRSFIADSMSWDVELSKALLFCLSPGLRTFELRADDTRILVSSDSASKSDLSPASLSCVRSCTDFPWKVARSYPHLETFRLQFSDPVLKKSKLLADALFTAGFLTGLPTTLTDLTTSILPCLDVVRLLPPSLAHLDLCGALPPTPNHQLDTLLSLTLSNAYNFDMGHLFREESASDPSSSSCEHCERSEWTINHWIPNPPSGEVFLPPHLTDLMFLDSPGFNMVTLPDSLTSIFLEGSNDGTAEALDPQLLLSMLPLATTSLTITNFPITEKAVDFDVVIQPRPNLKQFQLSGVPEDFAKWRFMQMVEAMPNVESFILDFSYWARDCESLALLEDLKSFNPRIQSLAIAFSAECFKATPGVPSPLALIFPELTALGLSQVENSLLDFSTIPKTVTKLDMPTQVDIATLHLLPSSVTSITASGCCSNEADFPPVLIPPTPPPSHLLPQASITAEAPTRTPSLASSYMPEWLPTLDPISGLVVPRLFLSADPQRGTVSLTSWTFPQEFPATITSLDMLPAGDSLLPNLTSLDVFLKLSEINLSRCPSLTSLALFSIETDNSSPCPPRLTSLSSRTKASFPESFLPLPDCLKILKSKDAPEPQEAWNKLPQLELISCDLPKRMTFSDWLRVLPASITRLKIFFKQRGPPQALSDAIQIIASRLPRVSAIHLPNTLTVSQFQILRKGLSVQWLFTAITPNLLAAHAGLELGSITLPPVIGGLQEWASRYESVGTRNVSTMSLSTWNDFVPFLSSSPVFLTLQLAKGDPEEIIWPQNLTGLRLKPRTTKNAPAEYLSSINLPDTITSLDINSRIVIDALPANLTQLKAVGTTNCVIESVISWPPNLRSLTCEIVPEVLTENLKALPENLEVLSLPQNHLEREDLECLPRGLRRFQSDAFPLIGPDGALDVDTWIAWLQSRNVVWEKAYVSVDDLVEMFGPEKALSMLNAATSQ